MSEDWCTIESDPGVFTELLEDLGCPGVELQELWSLDDEALSQLSNGTGKADDTIYGLIFLFQWVGETQKEHAQTQQPLEEDAIPPNLFFAHQTTTNACATQAILSVLLNADALDKEEHGGTSSLGPILGNFKGFTAEFPPNLKGLAISGSEEIRKAHNRFGRTDAFLQDGRKHIPTGDEEAFHFVAYIPKNGCVYELDGLQKGPILVKTNGESDGSDSSWLAVARQAIQERMTKAQEGSIKFNLMAVTQDKRIGLRSQLENGGDAGTVQLLLVQEEEKRVQWKRENERRRHNYVPFCVQVLKELAAMGKLPELVQGAKDKQAEKRRKRMKKK